MAFKLDGIKFKAWDDDGNPLALGKVYTYITGTSTPKATYTSESGATANTNPVILDANGEADIYLNGTYKIVIDDANDVEIESTDPVSDPSNLGLEWIGQQDATYVNPTTFTVVGNQTSTYVVNRAVRLNQGSGYIYGHIASSSFAAGVTTITITSNDAIEVSLTESEVSILTDESALPFVSRFSLSEMLAAPPASAVNHIELISYSPGWAATLAGPKGGAMWHKTGGTAASPSHGSAVTGYESAGKIGGSGGSSYTNDDDQAGLAWDINGDEWALSDNQIITDAAFGVINDATAFGSTNGETPTDNKDALNRICEWFKRGGRKSITFSGGFVYTTGNHSLRLPSSGQPDDYSFVFYGNHTVITQRGSGITSGKALAIGTDATNPSDPTQPLIPGGNSVTIHNLTLHGPLLNETGWEPKSKSGVPSAQTTGWELEDFINVRLYDCYAVGYWIGFKTNFCFTIIMEGCEAESCYIPFYVEGDSTSTTAHRCRAKSSRFSIAFVPGNSKSLYGQKWSDFHFENCLAGPWLDPGIGSGFGIADIRFPNFYHEGGGYLAGSAISISGITQANPGVVTTSVAHGFSSNDMVWIEGASDSMTNLSDGYYQIDNVTSTTFELRALDTSAYPAYTSGAQTQRPRLDLAVIGKTFDPTDVEASLSNSSRDVNNVEFDFGVESVPASPPSVNNVAIRLNNNGRAHNTRFLNSSLRINNYVDYEKVDGFAYTPARTFGGSGFNGREIRANVCQFSFNNNNSTASSTTITTANDLDFQNGALGTNGIVKQANGHYRVYYRHTLQSVDDAFISYSAGDISRVRIDTPDTSYFDIYLYDSGGTLGGGGISGETVKISVEIPRL